MIDMDIRVTMLSGEVSRGSKHTHTHRHTHTHTSVVIAVRSFVAPSVQSDPTRPTSGQPVIFTITSILVERQTDRTDSQQRER